MASTTIELYSQATKYFADILYIEGTIIKESEKAICFLPLNAIEKHKIWIPKKALKKNKNFENYFIPQTWFNFQDWQWNIVNKYINNAPS